jgi:molybdopterin-dependent oxidoreductase alpha subunit
MLDQEDVTFEAEDHLDLSKPKEWATGLPAVTSSLKHVFSQAGVVRGTQALLQLNQKKGFDCPSCAWPDPDGHRSFSEFCENGAKAVASETTRKIIDAKFFTKYSIDDLLEKSDAWHEQQGRLAEPVIKRAGSRQYEAISWKEAFQVIANELKALDHPNQANFYTSGRTSNEAAFLYQLMVRMYGTNNLPDCSNMCHESSGAAMKNSVGVGKGTVSLDDIYHADTIISIGQNPGTNHPRMLSALEEAVKNGAEIIAVNPLKEAGLIAFAHPQKISGVLGISTPLASQYLQVKVNGDHALLRAIAKLWYEWEEAGEKVFDHAFIEQHTHGLEDYLTAVKVSNWSELLDDCGIARADIEKLARTMLRKDKKLITCWAMGLTQHKNAVATIREICNLHLLIGAIGKDGAGLCPVRGHSNVQGNRTVGIFEKMPDSFLDALEKTFHFQSPRDHGYDTVLAIQAMHRGDAKVFFGLGGNFVQASPDTNYTSDALSKCKLTCHVATKLNRSHLVTGEIALILPCFGRSDHDVGKTGDQYITCENSMGIVQASQGSLEPISNKLLSEPAIVAGLATALLGNTATINWMELAEDYDQIRALIEKVIPGFEDYNHRSRQPGGFYLPNAAKQRTWNTPNQKANFSADSIQTAKVAEGHFMLQTLRSHDQYNTTVYGMHDRYRGIAFARRIVFVNPQDLQNLGIKPLQQVDLTSHWKDGTRVAKRFQAIPYDMPRGNVAAYFPEANVLVPIDSTADGSNTPTSKSIEISITPSE